MSLAEALARENFGVRGGDLRIGGINARELAARFGTPLYVYDASVFERSYRRLSTALHGFAKVYFSIKANPNPAVVRRFVDLGAGLEVASGGEFETALAAGCDPRRILFAGPGKGIAELRTAIQGGVGEIHLESFEEIEHCAAIAARLGRDRVPVAIRVNPVAEAQGGAMRMGGKPAAFGFDEEILESVLAAIADQDALLDLRGVHLFAGTQVLDPAVLLAQWTHGLRVASRVASMLGRPLRTVDLGGGLGIPYHAADVPLDLDRVAAGAPALTAMLREDRWLAGTRVLVEPGRYLAGPAGVYLMTVRALKESRGTRFVITDGGMHHHLAASGNLGQVIKRDYPIVAANRMADQDLAAATIVGPLCTPLDTLGRQTPMPAGIRAGDLIAVLQSGAYGLTASPVGFLSHPAPAEVLVAGGEAKLISRNSGQSVARDCSIEDLATVPGR